jgi:hypothetical protein
MADVAEGTAQAVRTQLSVAVRRALEVKGLNDPEKFAEAVGLLPLAANDLLRERTWAVDTSLWLIDTLSLPVDVRVSNGDPAEARA